MNNKEHDNFWELAAAKLLGETDKTEEEQFRKMTDDKENRQNYSRLNQIHQKLPHVKSLDDVSSPRSWQRVKENLQQKRIRLIYTIARYAAVIILAVLAGTLININWKEKAITEQFTEISVPPGQMSHITLYDGTDVWLNSGTTLSYSNTFGENSRKVALTGEAYFKVKKSEVPFLVELKNSEIEVLGTAFNVVSFSDDDYSQVTLVEGTVQVNTLAGKEITRLKPSEQLTIPDDLQDIRLKTVKTGFYKSWTEGKIVFHEERLADIAERLERWYNVEIVLDDRDIEDLRFSGTILKDKPFDQIAKAFEILLPVKVDYQNNMGKKDVIRISKK